jgi:hypothetical protein
MISLDITPSHLQTTQRLTHTKDVFSHVNLFVATYVTKEILYLQH